MHRKPHFNHLNIVVRPSDTLFFLAGVFRVSIEEILAANPGIRDPNTIFPGQIITIPADAPVPPEPGFSRPVSGQVRRYTFFHRPAVWYKS